MKKNNFILLFSIFVFLVGCSSEDKNNKITGKWKTMNNRNNTEISMDISDSTILTQFWFDEGIKKIQYKYSIGEETDSSLIIFTTNYLNITTVDTIYLDSASIRFCTQDGSAITFYNDD